MCKGERTLGYHRKMEFMGEEQMWSWVWKWAIAERRNHRGLVSHTLVSGPDPVITFSVVRRWGVSALQDSQSVGC